MSKKIILIFIVLILMLIIGVSNAFAQFGISIGGGEMLPITANDNMGSNYTFNGELSPAIDFGFYYLFDFGGSLGMNFLILPASFYGNFFVTQIHIAYTHEFLVKNIMAFGLLGSAGFDVINFNIGFGFRAGGHVAIAPDKYTRIGLKAFFALSIANGNIVFGFPMTLFFTFGFDF
jgi:hypothetical protein